MKRIKQGWQLTKKAWGVVRENPGLMKLPVIGAVFGFIAILLFAVPGGVLASSSQSTAAQIGGGLLVAVGIYLSSFSVIYFNVALAATADMVFRGEAADTKAGLAVARSRRGVIAQWAAVSLLVSAFFSLLRERGGLLGDIAAGLGAAVWALITFLIAPVLAFEGLGPVDALKRSTSMFKQKWGEQIVGNAAIGVISGLLMILSVLVGVLGVMALSSGSSAAAIAGGGLVLLGIVGFVIAMVVSGAVRGVFGVALYRYVADGAAVGPFTAEDLESSVTTKRGAAKLGI